MATFQCETCEFSTTIKCNFVRHNHSKRHLEKTKADTPPPVEEKNFDMTFEGCAKAFEKNHCKIINRGIFIKTTTDGEHIFMNETMLRVGYAHLFYEEPEYNKKGKVVSQKKRGFIKQWLCDHDIRKFDDVGLYPPPLKCPHNIFNLWTPFKMDKEIAEGKPFKKNERGLKAFLVHLSVLCNHDNAVLNYIIKWLAQMVQYPATKTVLPTFISKEGAGKGTLIQFIRALFGDSKVMETTSPSQHVWGHFNELMATSFFVVLNELSKKETMESENKIKGLITDNSMTINKKSVSAFQVFSAHRFIITTNNYDTITTKEGDRRNLIIQSSNEKKGDTKYFEELQAYLNDYDTLRTIWDYFKTMPDMENFLRLKIPQTEHQQNLKQVYRSTPDLWLESFARDYRDKETMVLYGQDLFLYFKSWCNLRGFHYDTNASKLSLALLALNITCATTKQKAISESKHTKKGDCRSYNIAILKAHYNISDTMEEENEENE